MDDIFISYASEDRPRVEPLVKALEAQGWSVFWDRTIPVGKTWRQVIGAALENARSVIVAWSRESIKSEWVQEEADRGRIRNILIPILIDDVIPPLGFGAIQAADLKNWDPAQSSPDFEKFIYDLSVILDTSPLKVRKTDQKRTEEELKSRQDETEAKRKVVQDKRRKKPEDKLIFIVSARKLWLPILLTAIGWAIALPIGDAISWVIGRSISGAIGGVTGVTIGGAIGGLFTVRALRQIVPNLKRNQRVLIAIGWAIALTIAWAITFAIDKATEWFISWVMFRAIGWTIGGAIGGLFTVRALRQIVPGLKLNQRILIAIGWAIALAIAWAIAFVIGESTVWVIGTAIGGVIFGVIGGGVMFQLLAQAKHSD
jgi:cation transport ATPase